MQAHPSRDDGGERSDNQVNEPDSRNNNPERKTAGHPRKRAAQHLAMILVTLPAVIGGHEATDSCGKTSLADFPPSIGPKAYVVFAIVSRDKDSTRIGRLV